MDWIDKSIKWIYPCVKRMKIKILLRKTQGDTMDTEKIKVLLTAIEAGSLTAAAEKLDYTPSGISRSVASLEEEMGFPLLLRSRNGVIPTKEGQEMLPLFRELLRCEEKCRQRSGEIKGLETGEIAVGTAYFKYYPKVCSWISDFTKIYPGIQVKIVEGRSSELSERLEKGELDFCIISKRENVCRWFPIRQDELVIGVPKGHPAAEKKSVPLTFLETEPYIEIYPKQETDNSRLLEKTGIRQNTRYATYNDDAAFAMVEAGLGVTLINSLQIAGERKNMVTLSIAPPHWVEIGIALPVEEAISPAARKFAAFAMKDFDLKISK